MSLILGNINKGLSLRYATATSRNEGVQPYKYGGKEYDTMNGLEMYDFHARQYDPAVGRFTSTDPHAENYYSTSPYAYCANNPLKFTDPTGMDIYFDYMGNFLFDDGMGNAFRVIERNTYIRYAKEIKQLQKEESFSEKEYNRRLRQLLTSPTKGNAKELTISDQEIIQALYLGMTTADYVYFRTNDNEKLIEYSVNILLDLNNLTIRFGQLIQGIEEGAKTSKTENGLIVIGQIHGHPDRYKPRTGSNKADSPDDKGIAKLLGRPVLSMEGGKLDTYVGANGQTKKMYMHGNIYYNLPNNQNIIFQYNGARDASSLIRAVVEMNAGKTP